MLLPMLSWSVFRLDESRFDGGLFSFLVLFFALWTWKSQGGWARLPGGRAFFLALLLGLIPLALSASTAAGWAPQWAGLADRAPLLSAWLLAAAVARWPAQAPRAWVVPLLLGGGIAAILGIFQALGWQPPGYDSQLTVAPAYPFPGPSHALETQAILLLLGLGLYVQQTTSFPKWLWLAIGLLALQVGLIGSMSGRMALLGAGVWLWKKISFKPSIALAAIVLLVVAGEFLPQPTPNHTNTASTTLPRGVQVRQHIYLSSMRHFLQHPLGLGLGRFETDYPEWRDAEEARLSSGDWADTSHRIPKTPHNDLLLAGLELGWLGWLALLFGIWQLLSHGGSDTYRLVATPAWIGLLVFTLFRSPWSDNPATLGLAALLLGWKFAGTKPPQSRFSQVSLGFLLLLPLPAGWAQMRGENAAAWAVKDVEHLPRHLQQAVEVRPWDNRSMVLLGSYYLAQQQWDAARDCFDRCLLMHPTDLAALTAYMKVEMTAPDGNETLLLRLLARAEEFAPFHPSVKQARILWLEGYRQAFEQEAVRRVQQGIPNAGPWWSATYLAEAYIHAVEGKLEATRKALYQAAAVAPKGSKGVIERVAEHNTIQPATVAQLTRRVFPEWPRLQP